MNPNSPQGGTLIFKRFAARAVTAGFLSIALTLGSAELASAEPVKHPADSAVTDADYAIHPSDLQLSESTVSDDRDERQLEFLDNAIRSTIDDKLARGEVSYSISEDGARVYTTEVPVGESNTTVELTYELDQNTRSAVELARGSRNRGVARASGNEWYPKIWFGRDSHGRWVRFNRAAQSLLINAGGTAVKAAVCSLVTTGAGSVGCGLVTIASIIAKKVMKRFGRCPARKPWLYAYPANLRASHCSTF